MKKRIDKGDFGYINNHKIYTIFRTVLFFAMALGIYAIGYVNTGTNKNLLTIVAILGLLPASKSCVNMIMFLRFKSLDKSLHSRLKDSAQGTVLLYENVLTTTEKSYFLPAILYRNHTIISYCENKANEALAIIENHLKESMKIEKIDVTVKVFKNEEQFIDRCIGLCRMEQDDEDKSLLETVYATIKAISL